MATLFWAKPSAQQETVGWSATVCSLQLQVQLQQLQTLQLQALSLSHHHHQQERLSHRPGQQLEPKLQLVEASSCLHLLAVSSPARMAHSLPLQVTQVVVAASVAAAPWSWFSWA